MGAKMIKQIAAAAFLFGLATNAGPAGAVTIYFNDFESNSTTGFSGSTTLTQAPSGANFLGPLSSGATSTLTISGLSGYSSLNLSFDLYTIYSMDGDSPSVANGVVGPPDYFTVTSGATTLFNYTFSNGGGYTQSFGGVGSPAGTGSVLAGQLAYPYYDQWLPGPGDYTYQVILNIALNGSDSIAINFIGNSGQAWPAEGFGIDIVRVAAAPR